VADLEDRGEVNPNSKLEIRTSKQIPITQCPHKSPFPAFEHCFEFRISNFAIPRFLARLNLHPLLLIYFLPFGRLRSRLLVCETDDHGKAVKIRRGRAAVMDFVPALVDATVPTIGTGRQKQDVLSQKTCLPGIEPAATCGRPSLSSSRFGTVSGAGHCAGSLPFEPRLS
jgi:hypothetical protein